MSGTIIKLLDGSVVTLFGLEDFERLVDKCLGLEAVEYLRGAIEEVKEDYKDKMKTLKEKHEVEIENFRLDKEADIEELNDKIRDLESDVKYMEDQLDEQQIRRY